MPRIDSYWNDHRVRGGQRADQRFIIEIDVDPDGLGLFEEIELPTRWAVCPTGDGEGKHVNPSIDSHGLSREDFDEDPDFEESYFAGHYDVPCYECGGRSTVRALDRDACTAEQLAAWDKHQRDLAADRACEAAERRMGA